MKEESKVITLLDSLPDKYEALVTALETLDTVSTWDSVSQKLLHHEEKLKELNVEKSVRALTGPSRGHRTQNVHQSRKNIRCFKCEKLRHISKFWRSKMPPQWRQGKQQQLSVAAENLKDVTLIPSAMAATTSIRNKWLIDSGASRHMCNESYSSSVNVKTLSTPIAVEIGDGTILTCTSSCDVDIFINVGGKGSPCRIKDVLVVPNLLFDLLSSCRPVNS